MNFLGALSKAYVFQRLFEWVMAFAVLFFGVEIFLFPVSIESSAFHYILRVINAEFLASFYLLIGGVRVAALVINGRWPKWGPVLRSACAGGAVILWSQMCAALALRLPYGPPSPGIPIYLAMTLGEILACYRAMTDQRDARV